MNENNVTRLFYKDKEIILIATAHVSKESKELVKQVIEEERPDSVCIELDEDRYKNMQNPKSWENTDIVTVIKSKKVGFLMANLALGSYQKRMAKKLDTPVGGEMIQGIESAKEIGAELVLADRSIQTTFMRIWRKLSLWEKSKLFVSLIFSADDDDDITSQDLQDLLQEDMLKSVMAGMRKEFPKIGDILIGERDQYLAHNIKNAPGKKVVAVLGGAHVPGIKEEIYKTQDIELLSFVSPRSYFSKIAGWIIPAVIIGLLIYAFALNLQTGLQQLSAWVLWTGALAALFTAFSLAHPLSILTSFVAAPFTTLNPILACGWFTGLVEASIKKPTVKDLQNVSEDIFSAKGFFRNRFLRIILVIFMANMGASIGTFIAGAGIIKDLFY
ncbi:MAG: TraB/GumN family protein [Eubacteriales bacterium]|nr:TraB/GumN family protein [Eubacteriales bacterium]MDD3198795.1 TraB/GumN family protein [Eubacteriales bacterium]MDD4629745.1 TraB/GumN family protein [Eubacteriales bacterium]